MDKDKLVELAELLTLARPYLEPARLREEADARERLIDRCPVRQLCKKIDAAALRSHAQPK